MEHLSHKRTKLLQSALDTLKHSTQFCKCVIDEDENTNTNLEELKNIALMYCQMDAEFTQFKKNIERTEIFFNEKENLNSISVAEKFDEFEMNSLTPENTALTELPIMIEFLKHIEELDFANNCDGDDFIPPTDPITKNPIKNPVKNPQCGHIYDYDSIEKLIAVRKNTRCPYIGCPALQYIKLDKLIVDTELKRKINSYNFNH